MTEYPWYELAKHRGLLQGDFINSCPIVVPFKATSPGKVSADIIKYNVIVMSQSCDLEQKKLELVLVCPIWELSEFEAINPNYKSKKIKENKGYLPGYHLLNKCEVSGFKKGYLVVDFRSVYSVPFEFLTDLIKGQAERLCLLPPYKEHLSQAFARFFMRVALPVDIPPFG